MRDFHRVRAFRVVAPPAPDRSAKVIALRSRRQARVERLHQRDSERQPSRPAA
jgi:hypothetical protein